MMILACDTSTKFLSVAIVKNGKVIQRHHSDREKESDYLFVVVDNFLKSQKIKLNDFDLFAIGLGPGSFTGLRIGICCFKTFAFCLNKPLVGINSFEAIACNIQEQNKLICVVEDAKKGKIYAATYIIDKEKKLRERQKPSLFTIKSLFNKIKKPAIFVGGGIEKYKEDILLVSRRSPRGSSWDARLGPRLRRETRTKPREVTDEATGSHGSRNKNFSLADEELWYPKAQIIAQLAREKFKKGKIDDPRRLAPLYLHSDRANITKPKKLI
jgi:tRNA threonylcarbamoyl adenosine modification protein YeaZ